LWIAIRQGTPPRWYSERTVVEIGARHEQVEMHVEAVGEQQRGAILHVGVRLVSGGQPFKRSAIGRTSSLKGYLHAVLHPSCPASQ
jgi:hypothetical protein